MGIALFVGGEGLLERVCGGGHDLIRMLQCCRAIPDVS